MKNKTAKIIKEVIEPQDRETIKYLSNVEDANTGEISQPFKIGDKSFQIVMGITPSKQEVMAVYCHDDKDDNGENILHPVEYFEENVVNPYLKEMKQFGDNIEVNEEASSLNLSEYNHFYVNEKTLNVRKFKTIQEVAKANMNEGETYMDRKQFKTFFENKVFGPRRRRMAKNEPLQNDELVDEGISSFWKTKLRPEVNMVIKQMVSKVKPYIDKLDTPVEKIQYIATLAKMLNLDANSITKLVTALKNLQSSGFGDDNKVEPASTQSTDSNQQQSFAPSPVTESKVIRKKDLIIDSNEPKIIKVIKVKDIK
jgi:hypothetical protein